MQKITTNLNTKCLHCGKDKGFHKADTANCPGGKKDRTMGYAYYRMTTFEPAPNKPKPIKPREPKLSKKAKALIESFSQAAMHWGCQQEYGSGKEVGRAQKAFEADIAELSAFVLALEQRAKVKA